MDSYPVNVCRISSDILHQKSVFARRNHLPEIKSSAFFRKSGKYQRKPIVFAWRYLCPVRKKRDIFGMYQRAFMPQTVIYQKCRFPNSYKISHQRRRREAAMHDHLFFFLDFHLKRREDFFGNQRFFYSFRFHGSAEKKSWTIYSNYP